MRLLSRIVSVLTGLVVSAVPLAAQYTVNMPYKEVTVNNVEGAAVFSGAFIGGTPGQPALPVYKVSFLLPPDVEFSDVTVSLSGIAENTLEGSYQVGPHTESPEMIARMGLKLVNGKDMSVYGKSEFFPADFKGNVSYGEKRQYKIVSANIYPYLYNPITKKLRVIIGGKLVLTINKSSKAQGSGISNMPRNARAEQSIKKLVVNPDVLESYGNEPAPAIQTSSISVQGAINATSVSGSTYAIIASADFVNNPKVLEYAQSLRNRGAIDVRVWSTGGLTGQPAAVQIRNFIIDLYGLFGVTDVVLIGNPHPDNGDVPMFKYYDAIDKIDIPTDWYYADFSQAFPDYLGEVTVGRIPVYNHNTTDLEKILTKSIRYINQTGNDAQWRRFALLAAEPLGFESSIPGTPDMESYGHMETINSLLTPRGWCTYRLYDPYDSYQARLLTPIANMTLVPEEVDCSIPKVAEAWKRLNPGLVVFNTHGCAIHALDVLSGWHDESVPSFNDTYPAMVYASSCFTADPNVENNLGYKTLYYNAINYTGPTIVVPGAYANELGRLYDSLLTDDVNNLVAGDALNEAKGFLPEDQNSRQVLLAFNLYGVPDASFNLNRLSTAATRLAAPNLTEVRVSAQDPKTRIKIVWGTVSGATGYVVERGLASATRVSGFQTYATISGGSTTTYYNTGLTNGTKFKYRVYATNSSGRSGYSRIDSATTNTSAGASLYPAAPSGVSLVAYTNCLSATWNLSSGADSYILQRAKGSNGPFVTVAILDSRTTNFEDHNIINGVWYTYRMAAVNGYGQSTSGTTSGQARIDLTAPTLLSVALEGNSSKAVRYTWQNDGDLPLFFVVEFQRQYPDSQWGPVVNGSSRFARNVNFGVDSAIGRNNVDGMSYNVNYQFSVRAGTVDNAGTIFLSNPSTLTRKTVNGTILVPEAPSNIYTEISKPEIITLNWTPNGSTAAEGWSIFEKGKNGNIWEFIGDVEAPTTTNDVTVGAYVTRSYCIQAYRSDGFGGRIYSDFSNVVTATSGSKLIAPYGVYAFTSEITSTSILLRWSYDGNSAENYEISRSTDGINYTFVGYNDEGTLTFQDNGLTPGTEYYYRIVATGPMPPTSPSDPSDPHRTETLLQTNVNIAIGKTASASSAYSSTYSASKGNDDNTTTRWRASTTSVPQWWKVDLGSSKSLVGSEVMWQETGVIYKYRVEVSTNNSTWTTVANLTNNTNTSQTQSQTFTVTARYVRIYVTAVPAGKPASFYEFRVFGQ